MRVFLTGGTGYIGAAVLDSLLRAGHRVTALVRDPEKAARLSARGVTPVTGELASPKTFAKALVDIDAAVHAAFEGSPRGIDKDREAIDTLVGALKATKPAAGITPTLIYTSGIWVIGNTTKPADEETPVDPVPHVSWRPAHEQQVLDAGTNGLRTIIVRPGIVYGGSRGIVSDILKDALNGMMRVIGAGKNRWPTVYARDVGDLYARLLEAPDAQGIFHANDETDERVNDIVEAIAEHVTQRPEIRHMPLPEARRKLGTYAAPEPRRWAGRRRCRASPPTCRACSRNSAAADAPESADPCRRRRPFTSAKRRSPSAALAAPFKCPRRVRRRRR